MTSGFKDLHIEWVNVSFEFDSPEEFTAFTSKTAGPLPKNTYKPDKQKKKRDIEGTYSPSKKQYW